jgi:hypothetical protein
MRFMANRLVPVPGKAGHAHLRTIDVWGWMGIGLQASGSVPTPSFVLTW